MNGKTNHIENARKVGGDYFSLKYLRKSNVKLREYLKEFNTDEYYIIKTTRKQKLIKIEELLDFRYSSYTFFKKDKYNIKQIFEWIEFFNGLGGVQFFDKKTPPFSPKKVIVRK